MLTGCELPADDVHEAVDIAIRGGGRDIQASFDYPCRRNADSYGGHYVPVPSSILYAAADNEALLLTYPQPHDAALCAGWSVNSVQKIVPMLVWIDNIEAPTRFDRIGTSSVTALREDMPELLRFSHRSSQEPRPNPVRPPARLLQLAHDVTALEGSIRRGHPRFLSAARRVARVEVANEEEAASLARLLGEEVAPGVRPMDICSLARTADGREYLLRERPNLVADCREQRPTLPAGRILFALPLPMKFDGAGAWTAGGGDQVSSYLRDGASPAHRNVSDDAGSASPVFWANRVATVTWIMMNGERVTLRAGNPSIYYFEQEQTLLLLLGDVGVTYFNNPAGWRAI